MIVELIPMVCRHCYCCFSHLIFCYIYPLLCDGRWTLESISTLEPRRSALEDDFEEEEEKEEDDQLADGLDYDGHEAHEKVR